MDKVVGVLTWEPRHQAAGLEVRRELLVELSERTRGTWAGSNESVRSSVRLILREVDEKALLRFLSAPPVMLALAGGYEKLRDDRPMGQFLCDVLGRETAVLAGPPEARSGAEDRTGAAWSYLGGAYLCGDRRVVWTPRAPGLPELDLYSPYAASSSHLLGPSACLDDGDVERCIAALDIVEQRLTLGCPAALNLINNFTNVIAIRTTSGFPSHSAQTSGDAPGVTLLLNPEWSAEGEWWLLESLVHEAVHDLLTACMVLGPWGETKALSREARSPWTQRSIVLIAWLHACFVWFALWHLCISLRANGVMADRAAQRQAFIAKGFEQLQVEQYRAQWADGVAEELWPALRKMRDAVLVQNR